MSQITICTAASRVIQPNATVVGTSSSAGLIEVQTSGAHGLLTGDIVQNAGIGGTVEADGQHVVTKVDATHFTLNGSIFTNAFTSGGQVVHLGFVLGTIATDNTVFTTPPDFSLAVRLENLSYGSNVRVIFEDSVDSAFATAQPLLVVQSGPGAATTDGEKMLCVKKRDECCDARFGVAGAVLRAKVFISGGAYSSAQLSAWLTY
jgi:hypothetical protein